MIKHVWGNNKQYAVLGLGRFGTEIVHTLISYGCEVLAVDSNEEKVLAIQGIATHAAVADVTDEAVLRNLDIDKFDVVIVAIGENLQASIICSLCCKELGAKYVVAKAQDENHVKILTKIGVDKVVVPEAESANRTAINLFNPAISEVIEMKVGYSIAEISVPEDWIGANITQLNVRSKHGLNVLIVLRDGTVTVPNAQTVFAQGDDVVVGGLSKDITKYLDLFSKKNNKKN